MPGKINKVRSLTVLGFHLKDSDFKVSARQPCVYPGGLREVMLAGEGVAASPRVPVTACLHLGQAFVTWCWPFIPTLFTSHAHAVALSLCEEG